MILQVAKRIANIRFDYVCVSTLQKPYHIVFKTICVMRIVSQKKEGVKSKLYMQEFFAELL